MVSSCHTCRATAYNGDFFTGHFGAIVKFKTFFEGGITDVLFNRVDADKILDLCSLDAWQSEGIEHHVDAAAKSKALDLAMKQIDKQISSQPRMSSPEGQLP